MVTRWGEKSAGLKILWVWTFGTAAILITSVVRTRLNDMDKFLRQENEAPLSSQSESESESLSESQSHKTDIILKDD